MAKMRPKMAKMRLKMAKMRLKMANMRLKMAKMRPKMAKTNPRCDEASKQSRAHHPHIPCASSAYPIDEGPSGAQVGSKLAFLSSSCCLQKWTFCVGGVQKSNNLSTNGTNLTV